MKIVILTDSLGLPRQVPEAVDIEDTYIEKLRKKYKDLTIISLSIGGATISLMREQYFNYLKPINPDLVIIQAGIVDCAPRALKKWELALINSNRLTKSIYSTLFKKHTHSLRKYRRVTYTPLQEFESIAKNFYLSLGEKLAWVGIIPARNEYEQQLPGIAENINKYNDILRTLLPSGLIDTCEMPAEGIMSDHHHINAIGHQFIFTKICDRIDTLNGGNPSLNHP
ncbi:SGNH/GDSL hydrolase family protein [Chitinophaga sp. YIM B06452]|uniref:SGNH/GDSL hydrolase family protein n=1 Tax=Chitinophaga sp. YIM B06452 TaxID=3082158 RepID=UPI0031FF2BEC